MRLPFSKLYRAFPELDAFTDAECQGFVQLAQREKAFGLLATAMGAVVAALTTGTFAAILAWRLLLRVWGEPQNRAADDVHFGIYLSVIATAGALSAAVVGFLIRDLWLRWAITRRLHVARCTRCSYSLLGLSVVDGRVTCPECGQSSRLAERGLTPADILAGAKNLAWSDGAA